MYALVGALVASPVFTSCVDDSESASVTAIRNAKAEQLKASAAYTAAQTEYEKALTAYKEAELAAKLAANAEDAALSEYKVAALKAQYEASVLNYEKTKLVYLQAMKNLENDNISSAADNYSIAIDKINSLNAQLTEAKIGLAQAGLDSTKNVALLKAEVEKQNAIIAEATAQIERIKALEGDSKEELEMKLENLKDSYRALKKENAVATDAETKALDAVKNAVKAYDNTDYAKAIADLNTTYSITCTANKKFYELNKDGEAPTTPGTTTIEAGKKYEYTANYTPATESSILAKRQLLNTTLKTAKDNLGSASTAADANDAKGGYIILEALEAAVKAAKDGMALETPTHDQDDVDAAELLLAQYKDDATNIIDWDNVTAGVQPGFAYLLKQVADAEKNIAKFEALLAAVTEGSEEHKAWVAAQEALLAAVEAYNEADAVVAEIGAKLTANGITSITINANNEEVINPTNPTTGEYAILHTLIENTVDAATLIAGYEEDIIDAKAAIEEGIEGTTFEYQIVEITSTTSYWDNNTNSYRYTYTYSYSTEQISDVSTEDLKALYEKRIANIEAKIDVQEALVAKYKAELDALLTAEA
ncbi:MAG: hypothetical protein IJZ42_01075 [Lachnospiraceae bacterium]|nr:hypothetical protein [Lachnospiraceae bacterium]